MTVVEKTIFVVEIRLAVVREVGGQASVLVLVGNEEMRYCGGLFLELFEEDCLALGHLRERLRRLRLNGRFAVAGCTLLGEQAFLE